MRANCGSTLLEYHSPSNKALSHAASFAGIMNRFDAFSADQFVDVETKGARPWNRREFVKGLAAATMEDLVEVEPVGELSLKGFLKPVTTFKVLRFKDTPH